MIQYPIQYHSVFNHTEKLPIVALVTTGRTGSDFFHSLLDGHTQILQTPVHLDLHYFWSSTTHKKDLKSLIRSFIEFNDGSYSHIWLFESHHRKIERWDRLGPNQNESFIVDSKAFEQHMFHLMQDQEINCRNFFLSIHAAYSLAQGKNPLTAKIIFCHVHNIEKLKNFILDFPKSQVIATTRDPRNTLVSGMEHWKKYEPSCFNSRFYFELLTRIMDESERVLQYTSNLQVLKLEDLHMKTEAVFNDFTKKYDLKIEPCLLKSTFNGKEWWGDLLSKVQNGFNPNINKKNWIGKITELENFWMEFLLEPRLRHYQYEINQNGPFLFRSLFTLLLIFLPTRYELKILAHRVKNAPNVLSAIKSIFLFVFYYLKRQHYLLLLWKKRIQSAVHLPNYLGAN